MTDKLEYGPDGEIDLTITLTNDLFSEIITWLYDSTDARDATGLLLISLLEKAYANRVNNPPGDKPAGS